MSRRAEIVVLGTGGVGSACLFQLARRGVSALGIDAFPPGHSRGSSHGDTRIIRQAYFEHPSYVPLIQRAYGHWRDLESDSGHTLMELCGLALAGPPNGDAIRGSRLSAGIHQVDLRNLSTREAEDRLPGFQIPDGLDVVFEPEAGFLHVEDAVRSHVDRAVAMGARLALGEKVKAWSSNGRTVTLKTDSGEIEADSLVVTAGAWTSQILADLDDAPTIKILRKVLMWHPVRTRNYSIEHGGCAFLFEIPGGTFYGLPCIDGKTLKLAEHTGGEVVSDPDQPDRTLRESDVAPIASFIDAVMPDLDRTPVRHTVCMYSMSPDSHFILDRHPRHPNVVIGAGFSGHGFKFTPTIGEALTDLVLNGSTELPIDFLSLDRFRNQE